MILEWGSQLRAAQDTGLLSPRSLQVLSLFFHEYILSFACLPTSKLLKTALKRRLHSQRPVLPTLQSDSLISKGPLNSLLKEIPTLTFTFYEKINKQPSPSS